MAPNPRAGSRPTARGRGTVSSRRCCSDFCPHRRAACRFAEARHGIGQRAELRREFLEQEKFFVSLAGRSDDGHRASRSCLSLAEISFNTRGHECRPSRLRAPHPAFEKPVFAPSFVIQTAGVAHPAGVHRFVLARLRAVNFLLARPDDDVAAGCRSSAQRPGVSFKNQTRIWKRKSFEVSAPTGQMSPC